MPLILSISEFQFLNLNYQIIVPIMFIIVSILIPIIVVIGAVVNGLVESAKASGGGFLGNTPTMPDVCVPALFITATIIIAGMIVQTKAKEPGV